MSTGGLSPTRLARLCEVLERHVESRDVPGLVALVSRRGETHVEAIGTLSTGSGEPMRRETIFRISSMTKPIAATAAMILVEECRLRLDEPVDALLPELANRRVLKRKDGPLDDTEPAKRPITLRDLLTLRMGLGHIMEPAEDWPIQQAIDELGILQGPPVPQEPPPPDEWMRRLGTLPLLHHPGEAWMYDLGIDVLGVLIARAAGQPLPEFLRERLFEPLGMKDTGFFVPESEIHRLPGCYRKDPETGAFEVFDAPESSGWSRPPAFPSAGGGLVSTVDDYLAFCRMLLDHGQIGGPHSRERILSRPAVEVMTMDHLTAEQKAANPMFFEDRSGWGFGIGVDTRRDDLWVVPGRFGWAGGLGTAGYTDPREGLIGIFMAQCLLDSPQPPRAFTDFWTLAYQAIDD